MLQYTETFVPYFYPPEEKSRYFPPNFQKFPSNLFKAGSFLSTECSSLSSVDGVYSSSNSEKDSPSPICKNFVDQTNYRVKYKTEICKYWRERGFCEYGDNCAFAHGYDEMREKVHVPSNYKTKKCKKFHESGYCPYGPRCQFLHVSNQKTQSKGRCNYMNVNSYTEFINNVHEFWSKDSKSFFWLYQSRSRLEVFQKCSAIKDEKHEEKELEVTDIIFQKNE